MTAWEAEETWEPDFAHYPRPVSPLTESYVLDPVGPGTEVGFAEWSVPFARFRRRAFNGWVYQRADPFEGETSEIEHRMMGFDRFVREEGLEANVPTWDRRWRPEAERRMARLRAFDPAAADDEALEGQLRDLYDFLIWAWGVHIQLHMVCSYVRARFHEASERLLGLTEFEAYALIHRTDPVNFEATRRLVAMARRAPEDPRVMAALEEPADRALEGLRGTWFEEELGEFLRAEGDRSVDSIEPTDPTYREMPDLVVALVKGMIESGYDPASEEAHFQADRRRRIDDLRGRLGGSDLEEFDYWLALGEQAYPLNEKHDYLLQEMPTGLVRYAALEAGRRLKSHRRLAQPEDVHYLRHEEILAGLRGNAGLRSLVEARREEHRRSFTLEPPAFIGEPPQPPPYDLMPSAAGAAIKAILDQVAKMFGAPRPSGGRGELLGTPGSPGVAEGPARVVLSSKEFLRVKPGDVLVCPITTPAWTILFPTIAGLVTDSGGALSHPAIVAREYGVPSVVGTGRGTELLKDGQRLRVDGSSGVVRILESSRHEPVP